MLSSRMLVRLLCQSRRPAGFVVRHGSSGNAIYDAPTNTTVSILNEEVSYLMVDSYGTESFTLNNKVRLHGSILLFPTAVLSWRVKNFREVNEESLSLLWMLDPKPDVLMVGYGGRWPDKNHATFESERSLNRTMAAKILTLTAHLRKQGLMVEFMPTADAIGAYNYLCSEHRLAAAALIPPSEVPKLTTSEVMQTSAERVLDVS